MRIESEIMKQKMNQLMAASIMVAGLLLLFTVTLFAQDANPAPGTEAGTVAAYILGLTQKYPWAVTVFMVIGVLRLVMKPLFTFLHEVVNATPTDWDNQMLAKVEASPVLKWVFWALDLVGSIKVVNPNAK